jgi:hypothetical protein
MRRFLRSAICDQAEATVRGTSYQQELNLDRMFADVAHFVQEASAPAQVRHLLDRCVRVAKANNEPGAIGLSRMPMARNRRVTTAVSAPPSVHTERFVTAFPATTGPRSQGQINASKSRLRQPLCETLNDVACGHISCVFYAH